MTKRHFNGTSWGNCTSTTRECDFAALTAAAGTERRLPDLRTLRADSHELYLAEEVVARSPQAFFSTSLAQVHLRERRAGARARLLTIDTGAEQEAEIRARAKRTAASLPEASGEVLFTPAAVNEGEVYDVLYTDLNGDRVAVSCKLAAVEDKAYRFSTKNYNLSAVDEVTQNIFGVTSTGSTYQEVLDSQNLTVSDYQKQIIDAVTSILADDTHADHPRMLALVKDKFLGNGNYYRTLPDDSLLHFPAVPADAVLSVTQVIPTTRAHTVQFNVAFTTAGLTSEYEINFRVKFKDGVNKKVKFNAAGLMENIAATVKVMPV